MTKIEDIISRAKDQKSVSVSDLLRDAKILANKFNQNEFLSWINLELYGYEKDSIYPTYRNLQGQLRAWNPFYGWVPVIINSSEIEEKLSNRQTSQSVSEIEGLLSEKGKTYEMPIPGSISDKLLEGPIKTKVSLFIDRAGLIGALNAVRDNILDWAIKLEKQGIKGDDERLLPSEKEKAQKIETKYSIENIENFQGNIGEQSKYIGKLQSPRETILSKIFWYMLVALGVVVAGNILSALILKYIFNMR